MPDVSYVSDCAAGVLLRIFVQPRASKNKIVGTHGDELKVAVTAPPVENAANDAVCRFFADLLSVPKSAVSVKSGSSSRHKTIAVSGVTAAAARVSIEAGIETR